MSATSSNNSFNSTVSSVDSYVNLDLTPASSFEFNGPIIGFLADNDCGSLIFCDEVSQSICAELVDNMQNATLSPNALEFRCKVFGSIFGREAAGPKPKGGRKSLTVKEEDDAYIRGSDDEDTPRPVLTEVPKVKKTAVKRKIGPVPPRTLPALKKAKTVAARKVGDAVQKRRNTGRGMIPKRSYNWKDPEKNKKKLYGKLALEAGVTINEYLAANNIAEGSTTNNSERSSIVDDLSEEEEEMEIKNDDSTESDDDFQNEEEMGQDKETHDDLFVDQAGSRAHQPAMTDRRVAILAGQYFDDLSKLADAEPVNDVSIAVKSALQKIKAGRSSQLSAAEQVELHLAVSRYEATS